MFKRWRLSPDIKRIRANSPQKTAILLSSILQPCFSTNSDIFSTRPILSGPTAVNMRLSLSAMLISLRLFDLIFNRRDRFEIVGDGQRVLALHVLVAGLDHFLHQTLDIIGVRFYAG